MNRNFSSLSLDQMLSQILILGTGRIQFIDIKRNQVFKRTIKRNRFNQNVLLITLLHSLPNIFTQNGRFSLNFANCAETISTIYFIEMIFRLNIRKFSIIAITYCHLRLHLTLRISSFSFKKRQNKNR